LLKSILRISLKPLKNGVVEKVEAITSLAIGKCYKVFQKHFLKDCHHSNP
jgi:hypothetical protein